MSTRHDPEVQAAFDAGYTASPGYPSPYLYSSILWEAFEIGRHLHATGRPHQQVSKSRGSSYRTSTSSLYRLNYTGPGKFDVERIQ